MRPFGSSAALLAAIGIMPALLTAGCGDMPPDDVLAYDDCIRLNRAPIDEYEGDPHRGSKDVFVCNLDEATVQTDARPFPDGTLVVKVSTRAGESAPWLIATARKRDGQWRWDEYTRNFADEDFRRLLVGQDTCTDCHKLATSRDWIFTQYEAM